jgi:YD repeat-containing protein
VWTDPAVTPSPLTKTTYSYDHTGNLSRVLRATGDATYERAVDYTYDGLNRLRQETQYPSWPTTTPTLVSTATYDLASNRATAVDPLGQTTTFAYDARNRLTGLDYSDPATADVTYAYDANNNRTSLADGTGTTTYTYD